MTGQLRLNQQRAQVRLSHRDEAEYGYAGSAATELPIALVRLFGESAERFALLPTRTGDGLATFGKLGDQRALDPRRVVAGVKRQPPRRSSLGMRWLEGRPVNGGAPRLLPRQLVEVPYFYARGEAILRSPITTGAAAGSSVSDCAMRGLLEAIERDAFVLAWLRQARLGSLAQPRIDHPDTVHLQRLLQDCTRCRLFVALRRIPTLFPVSVVAAFVFDDSNIGPHATVGASAGFDEEEAALKALLEALQLRSWLRSERNRLTRMRAKTQPLSNPVQTLRQRAALLFRRDYAEVLHNWVDQTNNVPVHSFPTISVGQLAAAVESQDASVTVVDLSERLPPAVRDRGIFVAKVVVPELQPLWLNDFAKDIAWLRITGRSNRSDSTLWRERNSFPHPFL
jgi:ribosomal protein S12 methylthiotransferase accessory factor